MFLIYTPDGEETQKWEFKLGRLRSMEIEAIEKLTGLDYGSTFKQALLQGNARARRALLWTFLRRDHPRLKFSDVDFFDEEVEVTLDRAEWGELRTETEAAAGVDEDARAQALAAIDMAIAQLDDGVDEADVEAGDGQGKAPSSPDAATTA
ncbi:hypothetical protein Val02_82120 [Virgisporangium aliadipatigenens]|uniref:Uncharacterized protein n=1 Tax=Virgisporangium aliadipatigenens TaxID=741659 RepID=A0A8J4DVD1_9ACTN|nr:hypothetical protein [Virgisporangium aliadipatigenens]GIJ51326.1 hypothetical protein Val02_82120 [Virgisporangium aliadipatigenens]